MSAPYTGTASPERLAALAIEWHKYWVIAGHDNTWENEEKKDMAFQHMTDEIAFLKLQQKEKPVYRCERCFDKRTVEAMQNPNEIAGPFTKFIQVPCPKCGGKP